MPDNKTICTGVLENARALAAGIISSAVTSRIPTTLIAAAMTIASSSMNTKRTIETLTPSVRAISSLTEMDINARHSHANTDNIKIVPIYIHTISV